MGPTIVILVHGIPSRVNLWPCGPTVALTGDTAPAKPPEHEQDKAAVASGGALCWAATVLAQLAGTPEPPDGSPLPNLRSSNSR